VRRLSQHSKTERNIRSTAVKKCRMCCTLDISAEFPNLAVCSAESDESDGSIAWQKPVIGTIESAQELAFQG
jgi:hypothetical protein